MKRFLGMTAEEVAENESMWKEENVDEGANLSASAELRGSGITANNMSSDIGGLSDTGTPPPEEMGGEMGADAGGGAPGSGSPTPAPAA
jgi:hypothetical protein